LRPLGQLAAFELALGVNAGMDGDVLLLSQERGGRVTLNEQDSICVSMPIKRSNQLMLELVYEVVQAQFSDALDYISWTLDCIDKTERLTHVAIAANITGAEHMAWRTQRESDASPNSTGMAWATMRRLWFRPTRRAPRFA